jgi:PAS domain-containing protein
MAGAETAQSFAGARERPAVTHQGTTGLSSLILRLEQLSPRIGSGPLAPLHSDQPRLVPAQVDSDPQPAAGPEPAATESDLPATSTETADTAQTDQPAATSEAVADEGPSEDASQVVDISAAERQQNATTLNRWSAAVAASYDACFVIDTNGIVISASADAADLLGVADGMVIGRHILDVVTLVDLESGAPNPDYAPRITPLVVLDAAGLARSIMRVRRRDRSIATLDSSSAPIHDAHGDLLGSVTFLGRIPA